MKVTPEQRREIAERVRGGETCGAVAEDYGISLQRVYQISTAAPSEAPCRIDWDAALNDYATDASPIEEIAWRHNTTVSSLRVMAHKFRVFRPKAKEAANA